MPVASSNNWVSSLLVSSVRAAADVVDLARATRGQHHRDAAAVVVAVQPVVDVVPLAVQGNVQTVDEARDEGGNDFLGKVVRALVVGAPRDREVEAVGAVVAAREEVTAGLRGGLRRVRLEGALFVP